MRVTMQIRPRSWSIYSASSLHLTSALTKPNLQSSCAPKTYRQVSRGKGRAQSSKWGQQTESPRSGCLHRQGTASLPLQHHSCNPTDPLKCFPFPCSSGFSLKHCYRFWGFIELEEEEISLHLILLILNSVVNWPENILLTSVESLHFVKQEGHKPAGSEKQKASGRWGKWGTEMCKRSW